MAESRLKSVWLAAVAVVVVASACADPMAPDGAFPVIDPPGAGSPDAALRAAYEEDAYRLAIRYLVQVRSPAQADVRPPAALVDGLYNALARVHAFAHPARDSVVGVHRIHAFPRPETRQIMVRVDPGHAWTREWQAGRAVTGNPAVDSLVVGYGLSIVNYFDWSIGEVALLRAGTPLNATALAARFAAVAGVVWAEADGVGGDGNDIRASRHGDGWRLDYSVGYGDCPAGCISRRTWSFSVSAGGVVHYLGASGAPPPTPAP